MRRLLVIGALLVVVVVTVLGCQAAVDAVTCGCTPIPPGVDVSA